MNTKEFVYRVYCLVPATWRRPNYEFGSRQSPFIIYEPRPLPFGDLEIPFKYRWHRGELLVELAGEFVFVKPGMTFEDVAARFNEMIAEIRGEVTT